MTIREGTFYPIFPLVSGPVFSHQLGISRSNTAELKAIARNSYQELEADTDELNALRAHVGQAFGDLDFRNRFRFFYDSDTDELLCQSNTGTVEDPEWSDIWQARFHDGQFQVVSTGGIQSSAGFYGSGLQSIEEVAESGTDAETSITNVTKLFFDRDAGLTVTRITSGANAGHPEISVDRPFGQAQSFEKRGRVWQVDHNYGITPVLAQVMDSNYRIVIPDKADLSDPNTAWFYFNEVFAGSVYIASGGVGAASLVPRDPFYIVLRTDEQDAAGNLMHPNADVIFDSDLFYVNVDLDTDAAGAHKTAHISLTNTVMDDSDYAFRDGSRSFTGHVDFDDTVYVENAVTAEAFYTKANGEIAPLAVKEEDDDPTVNNVNTIVFSNASLTDNGNRQVTVSVSGLGVDHGSLDGLTDYEDHPGYSLIDGTRDFTSSITINGAITCTGGLLLQNSSDDPYNVIIDSGDTSSQNAQIYFRDRGDTKWTLYKNSSNNFILYDDDAGVSLFTFSSDANNDNLLVANSGNLGIGKTPTRKLDVDGKGYFENTVEAEAFYVKSKGEVPCSYVEEFDSAVEWVVNHNLNCSHFIAQTFKDNGNLFIPDTVNVNDRDTAYFYFGTAQSGKAVVLGVG